MPEHPGYDPEYPHINPPPQGEQEAYFASTLIQPGDPKWLKNAARPVADADGAAIAGLITVFVFPPLGIIFGAVSRAQAHRRGEKPSGVATAAFVLGLLFTAVVVVAVIAIAASAPDSAQQYINCINQAIANGTDPNVCPTP